LAVGLARNENHVTSCGAEQKPHNDRSTAGPGSSDKCPALGVRVAKSSRTGSVFSGVIMKRIVLVALLLLGASVAGAGEGANYTRKEDVVYGRKFGTALTMDVFEPKKDKNGIGLIMV